MFKWIVALAALFMGIPVPMIVLYLGFMLYVEKWPLSP
jgi:hypothetical protein